MKTIEEMGQDTRARANDRAVPARRYARTSSHPFRKLGPKQRGTSTSKPVDEGREPVGRTRGERATRYRFGFPAIFASSSGGRKIQKKGTKAERTEITGCSLGGVTGGTAHGQREPPTGKETQRKQGKLGLQTREIASTKNENSASYQRRHQTRTRSASEPARAKEKG